MTRRSVPSTVWTLEHQVGLFGGQRHDDFGWKAGDVPFDGHERRRHERVGFATTAWIHEIDTGRVVNEGQSAEASDLSRSGIGMSCKRMYYLGRQVIVLLIMPSGERKAVSGVVRSSRYTYGGMYHIGIEFCPMPEGKLVQNWLKTNLRIAA